MPSVAERKAPPAHTEPACAHCGLPVPTGYVVPDDDRQFCCAGCRTAWAILHEHRLDRGIVPPHEQVPSLVLDPARGRGDRVDTMPNRKTKPTSPGRRFATYPLREAVTTDEPERKLSP